MNPHPPLSSFPFVILFLLVLVELLTLTSKKKLSLVQVSNFLIVLLVIFAPLTYYAGFWGLDYSEQSFQIPDASIELHQTYAKLLLILIVPLALVYSLIRSNQASKFLAFLYRLLLLLSLLLVAYVSFLGGELVFNHGAGIRIEKVINTMGNEK